MQTKTFLSLELYRNNFANAREGINFVVECAKSNRAYTVLNGFEWVNNPIDSKDDAHYLLGVAYLLSHQSAWRIASEIVSAAAFYACFFAVMKTFHELTLIQTTFGLQGALK